MHRVDSTSKVSPSIQWTFPLPASIIASSRVFYKINDIFRRGASVTLSSFLPTLTIAPPPRLVSTTAPFHTPHVPRVLSSPTAAPTVHAGR